MTAEFYSHIDGWYDEESRDIFRSVELNDSEVAELKAMTPESIIDYLKTHCVGICNTVSGQEKYFIQCLQFGTLKASLQVNYYVWRDRDDKNADHEDLITSDEFDAVCSGPESVLDVAFYLDGARICMGQMKVGEICEFFNALVGDEYYPTLDSRP